MNKVIDSLISRFEAMKARQKRERYIRTFPAERRAQVAALLRVRDTIAAVPEQHFYMGSFVSLAVFSAEDLKEFHCGTTACIAGWACILERPGANIYDPEMPNYADPETLGQEVLHLDQAQAGALFYARGAGPSLGDVTKDHAIRTIDHLIETGKVDWNRTRHA